MDTTYTAFRFEHHPETVPIELKANAAWVVCDEYKVPLIATASGAVYAASSTDPTTWRTYDVAYDAWKDNEYSFAGIGRVIRAEEDLAGIDVDGCLDPDTGELTEWASSILNRLDSYSEVSPSGRGIKIWVKAPSVTRAHVKPGLEIYPHGRYFTVTGHVLYSSAINVRDDELVTLITEEFPKVDRTRDGTYDGPEWTLPLIDYLEKAGVEIYYERSDGQAERVYSIRCPWVHEHTGGDDSGTRVGEYESGMRFFRCEHAHCRQLREWRQFRAELDPLVFLGRPRWSKGRLR
jgi:hypothetical protein